MSAEKLISNDRHRTARDSKRVSLLLQGEPLVLRFLWLASKGYRFQPWNSAYLRWRVETYWGVHAETITGRQFRGFIWEHRRDLMRFLRWAGKMSR